MQIRIILLLFFISSLNFAQEIQWESTYGPPDVGITSLSFHPAGILFAGTYQNYLYRSTDQGENWENITKGLLSSGITDITTRIDGEIFLTGFGIYRSADSGLTWNSTGPQETLESIVTNSGGDIFAGGWSVVYRSTDNGNTWSGFSQGLLTAWVEELVVDSADNIYAGTSWGIYKSDDNGVNWTFIGPPDAVSTGLNHRGLIITKDNTLFVLDQDRGIFYTKDDGANWTNINPAFGNITSFAVDTDDNRIIVLGTFDGIVYKTTDSGLSWNRINEDYNFSRVSVLNLEIKNQIFTGTEFAGVFSTINDGTDWSQKNSGFKSATVYDLESSSIGDLFARTRNFIYRSTDNGTQWIPTNFADDAQAEIFVDSRDNLYASGSFTPGFRSTDFGNNWSPIHNNICCFIATWGEGPDANIYAVGMGFFKSTDNGDNWIELASPEALQTFAFNSQGTIFGGTLFGDIYRSTDGGASWDSVATAGYFKTLWKTLVSKNQTVFMISHESGGVHRSTDNGDSWLQLKSGLTDSLISAITEDSRGSLYVSTYNDGVFRSINNGDTWTAINAGLPDTIVYSLITGKDGFLYAGVAERGIYKTKSPVTSIKNKNKIPEDFVLHQNFPNPFNPSTRISFSLPEAGFITLKVYDILGNEVANLLNEWRSAGQYSISFTPENLSSGVYYYSLQWNDKLFSKKMLLLK